MAQGDRRALAVIRHLREDTGLRASSIDWERLLTINYCEYLAPGCSVIDVGAHHGMHSRRFLRHLRPEHLVLVEPIPEMAEGLRREFRRRPEVEIREVALGRLAKATTFVVNDSSPGESGLLERSYNDGAGKTRSIDVIVERLDDWDLPFSVDFLKVDVEGGEVDVLRGGSEVLTENRPIVSVEYAPESFSVYGHDKMTMYALAQAHNYVPADLFGNQLTESDWSDIVGTYYWDFLLVPSERFSGLEGSRARIYDRAMHAAKTQNPFTERWRKRLRR